MRAAGGGSIVNIGSMASISGDLGSTAYACSKAGVDMLTSSVALQYGKENIRCNCVRPGLIVTPQNEAHVPQQLKDVFLSNIEVNRYGSPADIACVRILPLTRAPTLPDRLSTWMVSGTSRPPLWLSSALCGSGPGRC